jgi:hypothetical protein
MSALMPILARTAALGFATTFGVAMFASLAFAAVAFLWQIDGFNDGHI